MRRPRKAKAAAGRKAKAKRAHKSCFVYVLGCVAGDRHLTYVGWTSDLERRLSRHNSGKGARSTRGRVWMLLHSERYRSKQAAMSREWNLKRDRKFRKMLALDMLEGRVARAIGSGA